MQYFINVRRKQYMHKQRLQRASNFRDCHRLLAPEVVSHFQTVIKNVANSSSDSTHQFFNFISDPLSKQCQAILTWERRVERSEMLFLVLELNRNIQKSRTNFGNVKYARTFLIFRNFVDQIYSEGPLSLGIVNWLLIACDQRQRTVYRCE